MNKTDVFVIDTNILISAFILPDSVSRRALDKARKQGFIVLSPASADEFSEVFVRRKFDKYLPLDIRLDILDDFISLAHVVIPNVSINLCRDPKDDIFLELAVSAKANCIVTGDMDLLVLKSIEGIPIKTIAEVLND